MSLQKKIVDQVDDNIQQSIEEHKENKDFANRYPNVIHFSKKINNQIKSGGVHAAALVISDEDLRNGTKCVLIKRKNKIICNWNMKNAEYVGLMKLDILGLSTLTVLSECRKAINEDFEFRDIPLNDKKTFNLINEGKTCGLFQLTSSAMTNLCKDLVLDSFEDLIAALALVRPGPFQSGMTSEFIKRRRGKKWVKLNDIYEEVAKDTYGLLIYQEQVMQVISKVAGLTETIADKIRKIIGKKRDSKEFEPFWVQFRDGCKKNKTLSKDEAKEFWDGLLEWARYGFNRSHSVAYGLIGYWTAWLKANYPLEFICSALSFADFDENSYDELRTKNPLLQELVDLGYEIIPPKIRFSDPIRWKAINKKIYVPFIEIRGLGEKTAHNCIMMKEKKSVIIKGFFGEDCIQENKKTKIEKILEELECFSDSMPRTNILSKYFMFKYPKKRKVFSIKDVFGIESYNWKTFIPNVAIEILKRDRFKNRKLLKCKKCDLSVRGVKPVLPSLGFYNVFIVGEAPGKQENKQKVGFYEDAPAGNILWRELEIYGLRRRFFHITNIVKCYPIEIRTPKDSHIKKCSCWLNEEIEVLKPRLILALGNTCLKFFEDKPYGIQNLSGITEWNNRIGAWICWCVHPSSVAINDKNRPFFEKGIKNFVEKFLFLKG
jgi:DNA polymerase-3 subunit alpha